MGGALAQIEPDATVAGDVSARPGFGCLQSPRISKTASRVQYLRREELECLSGNKLRMGSTLGFIQQEGHLFGETF